MGGVLDVDTPVQMFQSDSSRAAVLPWNLFRWSREAWAVEIISWREMTGLVQWNGAKVSFRRGPLLFFPLDRGGVLQEDARSASGTSES
jgi:hypothetical protein